MISEDFKASTRTVLREKSRAQSKDIQRLGKEAEALRNMREIWERKYKGPTSSAQMRGLSSRMRDREKNP